jgi:glucose-6-phosphate dehydrogenase assembly protein OpcA
MTATLAPELVGTNVPLNEVERELSARREAVQSAPGEGPAQRASMSNLIIYCDSPSQAEKMAAIVPGVVALHPARVLLLVAEPGAESGGITAFVKIRGRVVPPGRWVCNEQVTLHALGQAVDRLPYAVRSLLIGDLPTNLWWAAQQPPPLAGALLLDLAETSQQVIYDSIGWLEPARGVAATAAWLAQFERLNENGRYRVASDLNWRRLKYWRRLLGQALDPSTAPGALESITEVVVEHGPHAVIQAWELVSFLASRLKWRVRTGRVEPNVEITWQIDGPRGVFKLRIRRLPDGPSEVRRLRVAYLVNGQPMAFDMVSDVDNHILAVCHEGADSTARTLATQPMRVADLIGRQLSDREHDPVFRESMAVAGQLAEGVLGGR